MLAREALLVKFTLMLLKPTLTFAHKERFGLFFGIEQACYCHFYVEASVAWIVACKPPYCTLSYLLMPF
jgi:hypothetical protein